MWTIGRSQRVEEKKYRPIVRKIRYIIFDKLWQCMLDTAECDQKNSGYSGFFYNITELYDVKIPVSQLKNTQY